MNILLRNLYGIEMGLSSVSPTGTQAPSGAAASSAAVAQTVASVGP